MLLFFWTSLKTKATLRATVVIAAVLLPLALLLALRHFASPHTSDDVAVQVALDQWLRGHHHLTYLPSDNFLFKLPVYLAAALLPVAPQDKLLFQVLVLNLVSFACFLVAVKMTLSQKKSPQWIYIIPPAIWAILIGGPFGLNMMVANYRNIELGLTFLLLACIAWYVERKLNVGRSKAIGVLVGLSFFWFSDPFFLFLVGAPLIVFCLVWWLVRQRRQRFILVAGAVVISALLSKSWVVIMHWLGIEIGGGASVSFDVLPHIKLLWPSLANLMGISFNASFSRGIASIFAIGMLAIGVGACIYNALSGWREKRFIIFFLSLQPSVIAGGFLLSSYVYDVGAGRYLVLLPYYLAFSLAVATPRMSSVLLRRSVLAFVFIAGLANLVVDIRELRNPQLYPGTSRQTEMVHQFEASSVTKGYAQYWSANIYTYLTAAHSSIIPIECAQGKIKPLYWFMDDAALIRPAKQSFYLFEDNVPQAVECNREALENQFGPPVKVTPLDKHTRMLVYDYDIYSKLTPGK